MRNAEMYEFMAGWGEQCAGQTAEQKGDLFDLLLLQWHVQVNKTKTKNWNWSLYVPKQKQRNPPIMRHHQYKEETKISANVWRFKIILCQWIKLDFMSEFIKHAPLCLPFIPFMNFHSVVDICFCLLQQPWQFMTLLRYLSHPHLKADRLMISMLVAGFHFSDLKFITRRTHTPLCAFVMLFMTEISCRHRLFLTDRLSRGFFCCPSWQRYRNLPMKHSINQSNKNILHQDAPPQNRSHLPCLCLPRRYFAHSTDWVLFLHCGALP